LTKNRALKIIYSLSISGGGIVSLKIRLQRIGKKKHPFYRVVAADSRAKRDGVVVDFLGKYQPIVDGKQFDVDEEKVMKWLKLGAQPTDTIRELLKKEGIWQKYKSAK
jgi:small subunit ribosomal protein S16